MRITLLHNPEAGNIDHSRQELMTLLAEAGHEATYQSTKEDDYEEALMRPADLVIAAGGDGTVGRVARRLLGRRLPLAVIPLGTANNLARALGFRGAPGDLVPRLTNGRRRKFDVGVAKGPWGERHFFEGAGAGFLPDYLRALKENPGAKPAKSSSKKREMARHVSLLRRLLPNYAARDWQINLDDEDLSGRYILLEAMNIQSVGPLLTLAARAETCDGQLDFVAVRESDRAVFVDYLKARRGGEQIDFPLPARRFLHLRLVWEQSTLHFDDKLWPWENEQPAVRSEIEITVAPSALEILTLRED
jgi:diacylglycerol kinase (ATP)